MRLMPILLLVEICLGQQDIIINFPSIIKLDANLNVIEQTINITVRGEPIFLVIKLQLQELNKGIKLSRDQLSFTTPNQTESFKVSVTNQEIQDVVLVRVKMYGKKTGYDLSNQGRLYVHFINRKNKSCETAPLTAKIVRQDSDKVVLSMQTNDIAALYYTAQEKRYANQNMEYALVRYLAEHLRGPRRPSWVSHRSGQSIYSFTFLDPGQNTIVISPLLPKTDYVICYYVQFSGCYESQRLCINSTTIESPIFRFQFYCHKELKPWQVNKILLWFTNNTKNEIFNVLTMEGYYANTTWSKNNMSEPMSWYTYPGMTNGTNKVFNIYVYIPIVAARHDFTDFYYPIQGFYNPKNGFWDDQDKTLASYSLQFLEDVRFSGRISAFELKNNPLYHDIFITMENLKSNIFNFQLQSVMINQPGFLYFIMVNEENSPSEVPTADQIINCYNALNRSASLCVRFMYHTGKQSYNIAFERRGLSKHYLYYTATNEYPRIPIAQGKVYQITFEPKTNEVNKNQIKWSFRLYSLILLLILLKL